jgi:alkylation response protein AidB-like acyl-CoA dehydrogenase
MSLALTEEQEFLKQTAADFLGEKSPVKHLRALRDAKDEVGFSRTLWKEMSELGWTGIIFEEEYGGADLGFAELGIILEECGRTLSPYPLLSTVALAGSAVQLAGSEAQRKEILSGICSGETILALAFQETPRFQRHAIETKAVKSGSGYRLTGEKRLVLDANAAHRIVVVARTSGGAGERDGLTLLLVDTGADGLEIQRTSMLDSRGAARVRFDGVAVDASNVLGEVGGGADVLDAVYDRGTAALSAELLGIGSEIFDRTLEYLKTREQFGVKIGSFQALKHRAADMFCELELSRSIVLEALRAIDEGRPDASRLASAAKARASDTVGLVTREGLQMHGGIGMTDEEEIGLFLKRAKAGEMTLGDSIHHRDRFARLTGF